MKISEFKGENAIEFIGDIIEPVSKIFSDEIVRGFFSKNADNKSAIVKHICKEYATEAIEVLAAMQGITPKSMRATLLLL